MTGTVQSIPGMTPALKVSWGQFQLVGGSTAHSAARGSNAIARQDNQTMRPAVPQTVSIILLRTFPIGTVQMRDTSALGDFILCSPAG